MALFFGGERHSAGFKREKREKREMAEYWRPYECEIFLCVWREEIRRLRRECRWLSERAKLNRALAEAFRVDSEIAHRRGIYRLCDYNGSAAAHLAPRRGGDWPTTSPEWASGRINRPRAVEEFKVL